MNSGWGDLWLLVSNVSLALNEPQKKMRHVIELWAPWMPADTREHYVRHVWGLDRYQRAQTGEEIGKLLGLTNAERQGLKLWRFMPIDATREEIEAQRKARRRENRRAKMRAKNVRPREVYLAELKSRPKPWEAEGISRRTYYRRVAQASVPTIVSKVEQDSFKEEEVRQACFLLLTPDSHSAHFSTLCCSGVTVVANVQL